MKQWMQFGIWPIDKCRDPENELSGKGETARTNHAGAWYYSLKSY